MIYTPEDIIKNSAEVVKFIDNRELYNAISMLKQMAELSSSWNIQTEVTEIEQSYKYMMQYMADGINDPMRDDMHTQIVASLYKLTDIATRKILTPVSPKLYYSTIRYSKGNISSISNLLEQYKSILEKLSLTANLKAESSDQQLIKELKLQAEKLEIDIFKQIWCSLTLSSEDINNIRRIFDDAIYSRGFRGLIISALYLSLSEFYDDDKLSILFDIYSNNSVNSPELAIRSLVSILLVMYRYNVRVATSINLRNRIELLKENSQFITDTRTIFNQLIRSRNTEKITKIMREELMPELMKISPEIYKKFKGTDIDLEAPEENPEWKDMMENKGLTKKIQELNEIQMEGGDVMLSTFAQLKGFPFFQELPNWFMPYNPQHTAVKGALGSITSKSDLITNSKFMCNSDKYSLSLSIASMPDSQKGMLMSQFDEQNSGIKELESAQIMTPDKERETIANRYIHDIYRFYKLYNRRGEFSDPFSQSLNLTIIPFIDSILNDSDTLYPFAEFYMKNSFYSDAIIFYNKIVESTAPTADIYQKIGFCYQNLKQISSAIENYKRADLLSSNDLWTLRNLATCYKQKGLIDNALECYQRAERIKPDNVALTLNIGHCLLELGNIDEALKQYFKVDFLTNQSAKSWRPIAWCSFLIGNFTQSQAYYNKIVADNPTANDYLNIGHLNLVMGNISQAINSYKDSIRASDNSIETFMKSFNNDISELLKHNINSNDIAIICDKLKYDHYQL
ncbi:MAG: tetratricopeptide repeat protein [Bacteroidales bacterium]